MKYQRVLLKISGESLSGSEAYGINKEALHFYASEIKTAYNLGLNRCGNRRRQYFQRRSRSNTRTRPHSRRLYGHVSHSYQQHGFRTELQSINVKAVVLSGLAIDPLCEKMSSQRAIEYLKNDYVVIMGGGTGNLFSLPTARVLTCLRNQSRPTLKGTRVDGVYNKDPEKHNDAVKFNTLTFNEAYDKGLNIMDLTAFTLCKENNLPIVVFNMNQKDNLSKILKAKNWNINFKLKLYGKQRHSQYIIRAKR